MINRDDANGKQSQRKNPFRLNRSPKNSVAIRTVKTISPFPSKAASEAVSAQVRQSRCKARPARWRSHLPQGSGYPFLRICLFSFD